MFDVLSSQNCQKGLASSHSIPKDPSTFQKAPKSSSLASGLWKWGWGGGEWKRQRGRKMLTAFGYVF